MLQKLQEKIARYFEHRREIVAVNLAFESQDQGIRVVTSGPRTSGSDQQPGNRP